MIDKMIMFIFVLLAALGNAFAYANDPKVFQISHDDNQIACAEIDKESAFCWEPSEKRFLKLRVNQAERQGLQQNYGVCCEGDLNDYVSPLEELAIQVLNHNNYDSKYERNRRAKIRALGAAIYMCSDHNKMVDICESLPRSRGIRRLVESYWGGIGDWFG
jgi:hypothetical protein